VHVYALVSLLSVHAGFIFAQQAVLDHMVHGVDIPKTTHKHSHLDTKTRKLTRGH